MNKAYIKENYRYARKPSPPDRKHVKGIAVQHSLLWVYATCVEKVSGSVKEIYPSYNSFLDLLEI